MVPMNRGGFQNCMALREQTSNHIVMRDDGRLEVIAPAYVQFQASTQRAADAVQELPPTSKAANTGSQSEIESSALLVAEAVVGPAALSTEDGDSPDASLATGSLQVLSFDLCS